MNKLLFIGAGFLQSFIIRKANELGIHTIAIDKNPNSIGFKYAHEHAVIDIIKPLDCLKFAHEKRINGVLTAATDFGVLTSSLVARELNLPGINYEVAETIRNKFKVRSILIKNKIDNIEQCFEINKTSDINDFKNSIHFPVIVKPCDGSGSIAVKRVDMPSDLIKSCHEAIKGSGVGKAIIEDYVEGSEYGVESFVLNNEITILGIMGKRMTSDPFYAELGHFYPSNLDVQLEDHIKDIVIRTIGFLGINFGAVNMDIIITSDKKVYIIDIGARMGGNLIGSHIIPIGTGIDYMENIIRASLNDTVDLRPKYSGQTVVSKILALKPGIVVHLPNFIHLEEQFNVKIYQHLKIGEKINEYHNNLDGCGYIIASGTDFNDCEARALKALEMIDRSIEREYKD
jgi:biotin carboxylase